MISEMAFKSILNPADAPAVFAGKIEVGKKYITRGGVIVKVVDFVDCDIRHRGAISHGYFYVRVTKGSSDVFDEEFGDQLDFNDENNQLWTYTKEGCFQWTHDYDEVSILDIERTCEEGT